MATGIPIVSYERRNRCNLTLCIHMLDITTKFCSATHEIIKTCAENNNKRVTKRENPETRPNKEQMSSALASAWAATLARLAAALECWARCVCKGPQL